MASTPQPISPSKESSMRRCPGNDRCADCNKVFPQWASVTFGILICLDCAGKHRALGVQTSFIKSLSMDTWTETNLLALELGGNGKWNGVCRSSGLSKLTTVEKYTSSIADAYRQRMIEAVQLETPFTLVGILKEFDLPLDVPQISPVRRHTSVMCLSPTPPASPVKIQLRKQASLEVKCTICHDFVELSMLDIHSKKCTAAPISNDTYEELEFDTVLGRHPTDASTPAPLGLRLTKSSDGDTVVSKIIPGGDADVAGVIVGSQVLGINEHRTSKFDALMQILPSLSRPISFSFRIRRPVVVMEVELLEKNIGCSFRMSLHNQCIVTKVNPDGHAASCGVLEGSSVVAVNDSSINIFEDLKSNAMRPLRLRLHRYVSNADEKPILLRRWA